MAHYDSDRDGCLDALDLRRLVQGVLPAATNAQIVYIRVSMLAAKGDYRLHQYTAREQDIRSATMQCRLTFWLIPALITGGTSFSMQMLPGCGTVVSASDTSMVHAGCSQPSQHATTEL